MEDLLVRPEPRPRQAPGTPRRAHFPRRLARRPGSGSQPPRFEDTRLVWGRLSGWEHFDALLLFLLAALALGLRWRTMGASYWGDEAIAIGIAAHPVGSLPHYLANDGSPPLYYVMLHFWMELFGRSGPATHALSMIAGLVAIPAAWWSGQKLFGRRAARGAAALVATCAYLDYYSTETRMYSWLVLSAILAITCFVLAYRGAGHGYWAAAVVLMSAVLYLQYYGLYLLAASITVGAVAALRSRSRERLRATLFYGLACAIAFAPWVPQFLYQLFNTGAPWAPHPGVLDFFGDSFNALASAAWAAVVVAIAVAVLGRRRPGLSGPAATAPFVLTPPALVASEPAPAWTGAASSPAPLSSPRAALSLESPLLSSDPAASPPEPVAMASHRGLSSGAESLPSQPAFSSQPTASSQRGALSSEAVGVASPLALTTAIPLLTVLLAWFVGQAVNSWNPRYLGIAVVPALIPLAGALTRVRWGSLALWGTVAALAFTATPMVVDRSITVETSKSDAAYLLDRLRPDLQPGTLVISTEVTDTPVLALDLGSGFRYATPFGLLKDPLVVDWSDLSKRLKDSSAASDLGPLLAALPVGGQVVVVNPTSWDRGETPEAYAGPVEAEAIAANQVILDDPQLRAEVTENVPRYSQPLYPMRASLFVKTAPFEAGP
ncbi:MAG TPA: glycosyltransferase family 39 protein [Acidimicrobiales bacterium]|nr:glycosyltransferase family 39 protein [Acidimicrobiales bacterium]